MKTQQENKDVWALIVKSEGMPTHTYQVSETIARACIEYANIYEDTVIAYRVGDEQ